jgi:hypothetical protein
MAAAAAFVSDMDLIDHARLRVEPFWLRVCYIGTVSGDILESWTESNKEQ